MAMADSQVKQLVQVDQKAGSFRVNRAAYLDKDVFEQEKKLIFSKCWLYLGHGSELKKKGDFVSRRVGGRDLIFIKKKNGELGAFFNSCTHRGARICRENSGNARTFSCPYHGWVFNSEGNLISRNTETGYAEGLNDDGHLDLHSVPRLEQYRNFYFINYNPKAISLSDYLADAKSSIDAICDQTEEEQVILDGEHSYSIRANYKYLTENSYDGYHLVSVHATYFDYLRDQYAGTPAENLIDETIESYNTAGQARGLGNGHAVLDSYVPTGRPVAQWLPSMGESCKADIQAKRDWLEEKYGKERMEYIADTQKNLVIFPNLVINDILSTTVRVIEPEAPDMIKVTAWALGPTDETPELRAMRLDNFVSFLGPAGFGSPDDIEMLEISQDAAGHSPIEWNEISKGLRPDEDLRTAAGPPDDEVQMHAYWTQWDRVMRGIESLEVEG